MFERFTEQARQVIVRAQEESRGLKHEYIGDEHLLLGLVREPASHAGRVLATLEISAKSVRGEIVRLVGEGTGAGAGQIPFTPLAKRILEASLREALALGEDHIDTEHLLLAIAREHEGVSARILEELGADPERIRQEVMRVPRTAPEPRRGEVRLDVVFGETIRVEMAPSARRIWMSGAARALDAGRTQVVPTDLLEPLLADESVGRALTELGVDLARLRERLRSSSWKEADLPEED